MLKRSSAVSPEAPVAAGSVKDGAQSIEAQMIFPSVDPPDHLFKRDTVSWRQNDGAREGILTAEDAEAGADKTVLQVVEDDAEKYGWAQ